MSDEDAGAKPAGPTALGPTYFAGNDPEGAGTLGWSEMDPAARAGCCAAALAGNFTLSTETMRFSVQTRIAFALRPSPHDKGRRQVSTYVVPKDAPAAPALLAVLGHLRSAYGAARADEVERLIHPKRRWFPTRRRP